jgi:hypothetical protein
VPSLHKVESSYAFLSNEPGTGLHGGTGRYYLIMPGLEAQLSTSSATELTETAQNQSIIPNGIH